MRENICLNTTYYFPGILKVGTNFLHKRKNSVYTSGVSADMSQWSFSFSLVAKDLQYQGC